MADGINPSRVGCIGASQVAGALGIDPWRTPEETRQAVITGQWDEPPADPRNDLYMGRLLEPQIIVALQDELRCRWNPLATATPWNAGSIAHPEYPWLRVTPDASVTCGALRGLGECKCPRRLDLDKWTDPDESLPDDSLSRWGVPLHYAYQGQTQLGVARAAGYPMEFVWYPVLGRGAGFDVWVLEHSEKAWRETILEPLVGWYQRHVVEGEPCPPATPREARQAFNGGGKPSVRVAPWVEGLLEQRMRKVGTLRSAKRDVDALDLQILTAIGKPSVLIGSTGLIGSYDRRGVFRPADEWRRRHERTAEPAERRRGWTAATASTEDEIW